MTTARDIVRLVRPGHWIKNIIVLLPVVFALRVGEVDAWVQAAMAAAALCLAASSIYIVNDISDRQADRLHPSKRNRPLASGRCSVGDALLAAALLLGGGVALAAWTGRGVMWSVLAYVLLQLAYTFIFKRRMILDVICIALGFVLRAVAGAAAISVEISPWLIVCTFTICLFMGFCKRCNETATLGATQAADHRSTLEGYTSGLLTHLITLSAAIAVVSFLLYASSGRTVQHFGTMYLVYTLPIVVYAVFRFAMLSMRGRYADPTDIILHDWPLQLTAVLWLGAVLSIIKWGPAMSGWLEAHG